MHTYIHNTKKSNENARRMAQEGRCDQILLALKHSSKIRNRNPPLNTLGRISSVVLLSASQKRGEDELDAQS
jgi:hypothetical protein